MYKKAIIPFAAAIAAFFISSCQVIRPGQVGVKSTFGKVKPRALTEGLKIYNPFLSRINRLSLRTQNLEVNLPLPSKEGLTIGSEISILYKIQAEKAPEIFQQMGLAYENDVILPVFRSAAADITSKYFAKDMHSGERSVIETDIQMRMDAILRPRGIQIESVLMKGIKLPEGLARTIEEKLKAEQDAQRMEFVKEKEQRDAERRKIQVQGEKEAEIISAEAQKRVAELNAEGRATSMLIEAEARAKTDVVKAEAEGKASIIAAEAKAQTIILESEAQAKANEQLNKSLSPAVLRLRSIEAFERVSTSNNAKTVITDGKTPFLGVP